MAEELDSMFTLSSDRSLSDAPESPVARSRSLRRPLSLLSQRSAVESASGPLASTEAHR